MATPEKAKSTQCALTVAHPPRRSASDSFSSGNGSSASGLRRRQGKALRRRIPRDYRTPGEARSRPEGSEVGSVGACQFLGAGFEDSCGLAEAQRLARPAHSREDELGGIVIESFFQHSISFR